MAFRKATVANVAPKSALGCDEFNLFLRELKSLFEKGEQCGFWEQLVRAVSATIRTLIFTYRSLPSSLFTRTTGQQQDISHYQRRKFYVNSRTK